MRGDEDFGEIIDSFKGQFQGPSRRQVSRIAAIVVAIPLLVFLFNAFVVVGAGERAVIFSKLNGVREGQLGEGMHLNIPVLWEPVIL